MREGETSSEGEEERAQEGERGEGRQGRLDLTKHKRCGYPHILDPRTCNPRPPHPIFRHNKREREKERE